jgi:putative thioredoxin
MLEAFLNRIVPSQADKLVAEGDEESLREAVRREPGHTGARVALGRLLVDDGRSDEALEVLEPVAHDPDAAGLLARVRLAASDDPDVQAGLAALARGDEEAALTHLLDAIGRADRTLKDQLRAAMIGIFRRLGDQHPLTLRFRKQLARALY